MGTSNLSGLLVGIFFIGFFLLAMVSGTILLVNNEGRGEIFDAYPEFESFNLDFYNNLTGGSKEMSNININLSAEYNPELAISAADQSGNAIAANNVEFMMNTWNLISVFLGLIFGNVWTIALSGLLTSILIALIALYVISFIRRGD